MRTTELTYSLCAIDACGVDAQRAEVALRLEDKNKWSPSEHGSGKTQTLHETCGQGEAATHHQAILRSRHRPTHSQTNSTFLTLPARKKEII